MADEKPQPGGQPQPGGEQKPAGEQGGAATPTWRDGLAPEIKGSKSLDKFRGNDWNEVGPQVLSSYINLEKLHGGAVRIPGEGAKPEEIKEFNRKLGVPENADGYGELVQVPEGMPWNKEREKAFLNHAVESGMTKAQAKRTLEWFIKSEQADHDAESALNAEQVTKGTEALNKTWGANAQRNTALLQRAASEFGGQGFTSLLEMKLADGTRLGNHPEMNMFLWRVGEASLEHQIIGGDGAISTSADARSEIEKIKGDKNDPYHIKNHPQHEARVKHMNSLYEIVFPS